MEGRSGEVKNDYNEVTQRLGWTTETTMTLVSSLYFNRIERNELFLSLSKNIYFKKIFLFLCEPPNMIFRTTEWETIWKYTTKPLNICPVKTLNGSSPQNFLPKINLALSLNFFKKIPFLFLQIGPIGKAMESVVLTQE